MKDDDEETIETHPSFGMVRISRVNGSPGRLFGSVLPKHDSYIILSVSRGERKHNLGSDWYFGAHRGDLIEIHLSAAQFAQLITTLNVGEGVPCTIASLCNKEVEKPPRVTLEAQKVYKNFRNRMLEFGKTVALTKKSIESILEKKTALTKEDKKAILWAFAKVEQDIVENAPFYLEQFERAAEKVVTQAKAEIDAFMTNNIIAEGIRALLDKTRSTEPPTLELTNGNPEE